MAADAARRDAGAAAHLRSLLPQGMALADAAWRTRHRFLLWAIALTCFALPPLGIAYGWPANLVFGEVLVVAALGVASAAPRFDRRLRSILAGGALSLATAILVQVTGGTIEAHFGYFIVIALVALYQDWAPFLATYAVIAAVHVVAILVDPSWVYAHAAGQQAPTEWMLVHGLALAGEGIALLAFWSGVEQARARSDLVLDSAGEGILGLDSSGTITFANPAARVLFARSHDLIGHGALELMEGTPFTLSETRHPLASRVATPRGLVPVEWTLTPTVRAGIPIGFVMVVRDVTQRRQLESRLDARNRQQALVASLGHIALRSPLDDFLQEVAQSVARALEVSHCAVFERVPGHHDLWLRAGVGWPADLRGGLVRSSPPQRDERAAPGGLDPALLRRHGIVAGFVVPLDARGAAFGCLAVHHHAARPFTEDDQHFLQAVANLIASAIERHLAEAELDEHRRNLEATVQRRTAQLTEAVRELESFSYTVSHDLRSPLRAIDGFSRILRKRHDKDLPPDSRQMLELLSQGAVRMGNLIESVLTLARIGRAEVRAADVDLSRMAQRILAELQQKDPGRDVAVLIEPGLNVHGDEGLLGLALQNLLENAWKFTRDAKEARIEVRRSPEGGIVVADNGAGFDMAFASGLFQPFHRLHEAGQFEGTGIGLATVQRVIERHGGRIWADAEPGKGARFTFVLDAPRGAQDLASWRSRRAEDQLGALTPSP